MPRTKHSTKTKPKGRTRSDASVKPISIAKIRQEISKELENLLKRYTQSEIGQQVNLHQPQISLLWNKKPVFSDVSKYGQVLEGLRQLKSSTSRSSSKSAIENDDAIEIQEQMDAPSYTMLLTERMAVLGIDAPALSDKSKVALPVLNRILVGMTSNPQAETRKKIEKALESFANRGKSKNGKNADVKSSTSTDRLYVGFPFVESEVEQVPNGAVGVYAIHDRRGFPLYIGSGNLKNRLNNHLDEADFQRRKNASKFSYYIIALPGDDGQKLSEMNPSNQAREIERVLIRFSGNAVSHNTHHRTDLSEW